VNPFLILLGLSIVIGLFGIHTRFGFWGNFFASILFTPAMGLLLLMASGRRAPGRE
jgi:hypothetical protein